MCLSWKIVNIKLETSLISWSMFTYLIWIICDYLGAWSHKIRNECDILEHVHIFEACAIILEHVHIKFKCAWLILEHIHIQIETSPISWSMFTYNWNMWLSWSMFTYNWNVCDYLGACSHITEMCVIILKHVHTKLEMCVIILKHVHTIFETCAIILEHVHI